MDIGFIRDLGNLQGIAFCDKKVSFFYDETGNCGNFTINEMGVNDPTALCHDFILGGISYLGENCPADPDELFKDLKLKSNELKFRHINRDKDFMTFMGSYRLTIYLDWLCNNDFYVHYATINNLYYALVDMVDSLWESQPQFIFSFEWILQLKSALYYFCLEHLDDCLKLLYKYHYPNIRKEKTEEFCHDFCAYIQINNVETTEQGFLIECFRQMLKYAGKQGELIFLHENEDNILIDGYYGLYQQRCYTYKNSFHHFDFEKVIVRKMKENPLFEGDNLFINYDFLDSKQNKMIQVSDVFVGLLGKLFYFLDNITYEMINSLKTNSNKEALSNFAKIFKLIDRSEKFHKTMVLNINDIRMINHRMLKLKCITELSD